MELTINELDTIIEKTLGIYRTILKLHAQDIKKSILQQNEIFENIDEIIDFLFELRRREENILKGLKDDSLQGVIEIFDKQTKSEIAKMDEIIHNYYKKAR